MGTSVDILLAKDMDAVFSEPVVKAGLSAGWGPIMPAHDPVASSVCV